MLDRNVVKDFLLEEFKETNLRTPKSIKIQELVETFCQFTEDDYYEWLKDNFSTFFNHGNPDWDWIKEYLANHKK